MPLFDEVAKFENLERAFRCCARGKRKSLGYQKMLAELGDKLTQLRAELLSNRFQWSGYRKFLVHDPKARVISAPPFRDRVVHTAICQQIEPVLDAQLSNSVYACRKGKGNRYAVIELIYKLKCLGPERFVVKLDVERYFDSIDHHVLLDRVFSHLPDPSLEPLLTSLVQSFSSPLGTSKGVPIGSLSSQLFANFYLASADQLILQSLNEDELYLRYMDDLVIATRSKKRALDLAERVCRHMEVDLLLQIPFHKRVALASDPIPFLGFYVDENGHRILSRNERRHQKRLRRMNKRGKRESQVAQTELSFNAFKNLEPHLSERINAS